MFDAIGGAPLFGLISATIVALIGIVVAVIKFRESTGVAKATSGVADSENVRNQLWKMIDRLTEQNKDFDTKCKTYEGEIAALKLALAKDELDDALSQLQGKVLAEEIKAQYKRRDDTIALLQSHIGTLLLYIEREGGKPPALPPYFG